MSHVWGNIIEKMIVFVNLWTIIFPGVFGAKKEKPGSTSVPTSVFLSPTKDLFQFTTRFLWLVPLGNSAMLGTECQLPELVATLTLVKGYTCLAGA